MGDIVNAVGDLVGIGPASKQASATRAAADQSAAASRYAADIQRQIADQQIAAQREMFERQVGLQEPWRQAGINALGQMEGGAYGLPAAFTGQVNMMADPGYQFRLSEGLKALDRQAAARGGLISGGALKAAQRYGQDYATGEYGAAYNRALTEYNAQVQRAGTGYNRLAALAGVGQTSAGQLAGAAGQTGAGISNVLGAYGSNVGNLAMTNAANQGNALIAQGNIRASQYGTMGSALNTALNTDWGKVGSTIGGFFGGGSSAYPASYSSITDFEGGVGQGLY